jgi:HEAT repeat protein
LSLFEDVEPIRQAAFQAIPKNQYDKAVPYYADALTDETNLIVQRAASALGAVGDERVVPALIRALITEHKVTINVPISNSSTTVTRNPHGSYSMGGTGAALPANVELLLRTGQLPYGVRYHDPNAGYRQVTTRVEIRNEQVLEALKKLTSKDFGYDPDAWQLYWAARRSRTGTL